MKRIQASVLLSACIACGTSEAPHEQPHPEQAQPAQPVERTGPVVPVRTQPPRVECAIGQPTVFTPTRRQLAANRSALAKHNAENFTEAAAEFAALVENAPGYGAARFNLACAQTRAGRLYEARDTIAELLCSDLPTNLPRALADEDLTPLRAQIEPMGTRLVERYREASDGAAVVVAYGKTEMGDHNAPHLHWSQAGYWTGDRFLPAAPRRQARRSYGAESTPLFASLIGAVQSVQVQGFISDAEMANLPPVKIRVTRLFDGVELARRDYARRQTQEFVSATFGIESGHAWVGFQSWNEDLPHRAEWVHSGGRVATPPQTQLWIGGATWGLPRPPNSLTIVRRRTLRDGEATMELDARHRRMNDINVITEGRFALVHSSAIGDCGVPDRYVVEMVDLSSRTTLWKEHGEGQRLFQFQGGQLFMQEGESFFVLPDPADPARTTLPSGLGLSSAYYDFNPMC